MSLSHGSGHSIRIILNSSERCLCVIMQKTCLDSSRQWSESHITQAAQAVVEVSLRKGAMDNITCVVMLFAWG